MKKRVAVSLFLVFLFVAGLGYFFLTTSPKTNELCVVCHSMKPFMASIEKTDHGELNCHACHPMDLRAIRDVIVYIYKNPSPEEIKRYANVNIFFQCLSCHEVPSELHSEHSEEQIACNKCHYIHEIRDVKATCYECHKAGYPEDFEED